MKIETRTACWGIELKNDTVTEDIGSYNQQELKETMINFLEAVKDMSSILDYQQNIKDEIVFQVDNIINTIDGF